jgi:predicted DNA-binding transcriptional regulator AlpA
MLADSQNEELAPGGSNIAQGAESCIPRTVSDLSFMRVAELSKMLGIAENSIRSQMRLGTFPVPHRSVGGLIVVKRCDYLAWFNSRSQDCQAGVNARAAAPTSRNPTSSRSARTSGRRRIDAETNDERKARLHRQVLAELRRAELTQDGSSPVSLHRGNGDTSRRSSRA